MRRRLFITLLGGAAAAWPIGARGQPPSMPMVGFLNVGFADRSAHQVAAFRQGLKETGYIEGRNITVEFRWADGRYDRLPTLAADLIRRQAAVILTGGGEAPFRAVRAASETVPIVFNIGNDPVQLGLVASLAKPGGNATGVNFLSVEIAAKRLQLLNSLVPTSSIIAVLVNPNFPATESSVSELESAARVINGSRKTERSEGCLHPYFPGPDSHRRGGSFYPAVGSGHHRSNRCIDRGRNRCGDLYAPIFIFYRNAEPITQFAQFRGKRLPRQEMIDLRQSRLLHSHCGEEWPTESREPLDHRPRRRSRP
jgi:ABC transporter substrate binding protein